VSGTRAGGMGASARGQARAPAAAEQRRASARHCFMVSARAIWAALPTPLALTTHLTTHTPTQPPNPKTSYDYRFKEEGDEDKVPCYCGAPTCKGTLN
jgi:hypothetical protein